MAKTVASLVIERLIDWGVTTVFSLPGDGVNGLFEAWRQHGFSTAVDGGNSRRDSAGRRVAMVWTTCGAKVRKSRILTAT